jgi:hypothetical protein
MATAGALFMYLADEIGEQARLTQIDLAVAQFFHNHGTPWAVRLFEAITSFGNPSTLGVIGLVTAASSSPASGSLGDAVGLEFSQRARHGIVRHLWIFGLLAYPGISGRFSMADRRCRTCGPGLAHRVQPDLPRRTLPQRRHRWLRGSGRLAHLLHPRDRPDAKKVEHAEHAHTMPRRCPTGIARQSGDTGGGMRPPLLQPMNWSGKDVMIQSPGEQGTAQF